MMTPLFHWKSSTSMTPHYWQIQWKCPDKVLEGLTYVFGFWYSPFSNFCGHHESAPHVFSHAVTALMEVAVESY